MRAFRDYLKEQFKDKNLEEKFYKRLEKERIAAEILYYREKFNLTQKELAEKINSSQSAIARLEHSDYHNHSIKVLRKIASVLNLELVVTFREKRSLENEKEYELDSKLNTVLLEKESSIQTDQISSTWVTVNDSKHEVVYRTAVVNWAAGGKTIEIGTTVDDAMTSPSPTPIIRPNKVKWASA